MHHPFHHSPCHWRSAYRFTLVSRWAALACGLALLTLTACENDDTDFGDLITNNHRDSNSEATDTTVSPMNIELDTTALAAETGEAIPTDETDPYYNDYVEHAEFDRTVTIVYDGASATVGGDTSLIEYTVNGAHVTVRTEKARITFQVSGSSTDGSLKIYSESKFRLLLSGVTLTNPSGPAINNQCGKTAYVVLADSTENSLTDGTNYTAIGGEDQKGAFFSEGQLVFSGKGSLSVYGHYRHAIASDDYVRFRPGINVYAKSVAGSGIKANDGIFISGGVLNVEVTKDGAKGLNSEADITVSGGRTTVITSGATTVASADTSSCAALKCDSTFRQSGGILRLKSTGEGGKGMNVHQQLVVTGGELCVVTLGEKQLSSPKGIKVDESATISGGSVYAYSANAAPLDAAGTLTVASGYTTYTDDPPLFQVVY